MVERCRMRNQLIGEIKRINDQSYKYHKKFETHNLIQYQAQQIMPV